MMFEIFFYAVVLFVIVNAFVEIKLNRDIFVLWRKHNRITRKTNRRHYSYRVDFIKHYMNRTIPDTKDEFMEYQKWLMKTGRSKSVRTCKR